MINKVDRAFFELNHDTEKIYHNFNRVIENFNVIVSTYQKSKEMGDCQVNPIEGNVCMGSAYHGWGFSLVTFAKLYATKYKTSLKSMVEKLWGDNYYNSESKSIVSTNNEEESLSRTFCTFVLDPIKKLNMALYKGDVKVIAEILEKLNIKINKEDYELKGKALIKKVMQSWINVGDAIMEMIICNLPSPKVAQKYRVDYLYEGALDDDCAKAMRECDPEGPFMMFISKMVPSSDGNRFFAFGRVFSGKAQASKKVKIMGPNYKLGTNVDVFEKSIQKVVIMMGKKIEVVEEVPCGSTCALVGVDQMIRMLAQ